MSDYGVTDTGFKRKPKSVSITELENLMQTTFGQDLDVSAESPEGQIISVIADAVDPLWEVAEHSYNAYNPNAATGVALENLALLNNITKKTATATTVDLKFTGDSGITVPVGTIISTNPDLTGDVSYKFTTLVEGITVLGEYEVQAIADDLGEIQIPIGSMTLIDTPIVGITSVTNELAGNVGQDDETDPELRSRRTSQVALAAVATIDSIYSSILDIDSVLSVKVYENDSAIETTEDGVTISPHAIRVIVQGSELDAESEEIAQAIFARKSPGVPTDGLQSWTIQDSQGFDKTFNFDYPDLVPIYIVINTQATSATSVGSDGQDIKDAIIAYVEDSITGYTIGDNVAYARLFTPINSVSGHNVQSMTIGTTASPTGTSDLDIDGGSLAVIYDVNIEVNVSY